MKRTVKNLRTKGTNTQAKAVMDAMRGLLRVRVPGALATATSRTAMFLEPIVIPHEKGLDALLDEYALRHKNGDKVQGSVPGLFRIDPERAGEYQRERIALEQDQAYIKICQVTDPEIFARVTADVEPAVLMEAERYLSPDLFTGFEPEEEPRGDDKEPDVESIPDETEGSSDV